jgi:hypothetical protein
MVFMSATAPILWVIENGVSPPCGMTDAMKLCAKTRRAIKHAFTKLKSVLARSSRLAFSALRSFLVPFVEETIELARQVLEIAVVACGGLGRALLARARCIACRRFVPNLQHESPPRAGALAGKKGYLPWGALACAAMSRQVKSST